MRYYIILIVASLLAGCIWPTESDKDDEHGPGGEIIKVGRGVGVGDTFTEAFNMAQLIATADAVGINIDAVRMHRDGVYREKVRSRSRGTIDKHEILNREILPDGSKRIIMKIWVKPWSERPLFPHLNRS